MESEKESIQSESESDDRSEKPKPDKIYKMILIGNSGVGKTSLIQKALKNEFSPNQAQLRRVPKKVAQLDL